MCTCGQSLQVPALEPGKATGQATGSTTGSTKAPAAATASTSHASAHAPSHAPSVASHRQSSSGTEETYDLAKDDGLPESPEVKAPLASPVFTPPPTVDAHTSDDERETSVRIVTGIHSMFLDVYVPLSIMFVGLFVTVGIWRHNFPESWNTTAIAIFSVVLMQVVLFIPVAVGSAIVVVNMMDMELGPLIPAAIKLAAITLGPAALADGLFFAVLQHEFDYELLLLGFVFYLIAIGLPSWAWFRTDLQQTTLLVALQSLPRLAVMFLIAAVAPKLFGIV